MSNQPYPQDPRDPINQPPPQRQIYGDTTQSTGGGSYVQSQYESRADPMGNRVENREEVYEDRNQIRANRRYWIRSVTYFILGVLEVILLLRLIFRLLGANQGNSFTDFLYNLSGIFVAPFSGIFHQPSIGTQSVLEVSTLVAMLIYALIAWGIVALGQVIFAPNMSGRQTITSTRRNRL